MSVYLIQPAGGGHIKVGCTQQVDARHRALAKLFPYGIDVLAVIDGDRLTEGFIHCCFRPIATSQEWFRSEPALWRFVLDIADNGRPQYLPFKSLDRDEAVALAVAEFGSVAGAMRAMNYSPFTNIFDAFGHSRTGGGGGFAKLQFALALRRGELPDYIAALHAVGLEELAA